MASNGVLTDSELATIPATWSSDGKRLYRGAVEAVFWLLLMLTAMAAAKRRVTVRDGYRSYAQQVTLFLARYVVSPSGSYRYDGKRWSLRAGAESAAVPGSSNHGLGVAFDLSIDSFTAPAYLWLVAHAHEFGFSLTQGRAWGEPWHVVYIGGGTAPASTSTTEIEEDDVSAADVINYMEQTFKPAFQRLEQAADGRNERGEVLNIGINGDSAGRVWRRGSGGLVRIENTTDKDILDRYVADAPGDVLLPQQLARINYYEVTAPLISFKG